MSYALVALAAFFVSGLTMFSGFGLGTLLLPLFAIFLPVEVAVGATAVVHGANSLFKTVVVGRNADKSLVLRFGIAAVIAAFGGAALLGLFASLEPLLSYDVGSHQAVITPIKLLMGVLILGFAFFELLPKLRDIKFQRDHLIVGGLLSGFFGGLSGHQGALRSAFLIKAGVSTESFVGTNAVIALIVDAARLLVYALFAVGSGFAAAKSGQAQYFIIVGVLAAFAGVLVGKKFMHKITVKAVQVLTGIMLLGIGLALGSGII